MICKHSGICGAV